MSRDVAAGVAGEEDQSALEFVRLAHAVQGRLGFQAPDHFRRGLGTRKRSGAEEVHPDSVFGPIHREMPRHLHEPALERVVMDGARGANAFVGVGIGTDQPIHGADQDDAAPAGATGHMVAKFPGQEKVAGRVGELAVELFGSDVREVVAVGVMAVVDQDVHLAGVLHGGGEAGVERGFIQMIQGHTAMRASGHGGEAGGKAARAFQVPAGGDHLRARFRQGAGEGAAQVAGRAGEQGDFAGQVEELGNRGLGHRTDG